eukprot:GHVN01031610.1.p1 GENE.GHVN01031610.1~~GHVN01031610.1.p1  ORF type:complete len:624 (+),score=48.58 GHVN01031610.1:3214-5085(+)
MALRQVMQDQCEKEIEAAVSRAKERSNIGADQVDKSPPDVHSIVEEIVQKLYKRNRTVVSECKLLVLDTNLVNKWESTNCVAKSSNCRERISTYRAADCLEEVKQVLQSSAIVTLTRIPQEECEMFQPGSRLTISNLIPIASIAHRFEQSIKSDTEGAARFTQNEAVAKYYPIRLFTTKRTSFEIRSRHYSRSIASLSGLIDSADSESEFAFPLWRVPVSRIPVLSTFHLRSVSTPLAERVSVNYQGWKKIIEKRNSRKSLPTLTTEAANSPAKRLRRSSTGSAITSFKSPRVASTISDVCLSPAWHVGLVKGHLYDLVIWPLHVTEPNNEKATSNLISTIAPLCGETHVFGMTSASIKTNIVFSQSQQAERRVSRILSVCRVDPQRGDFCPVCFQNLEFDFVDRTHGIWIFKGGVHESHVSLRVKHPTLSKESELMIQQQREEGFVETHASMRNMCLSIVEGVRTTVRSQTTMLYEDGENCDTTNSCTPKRLKGDTQQRCKQSTHSEKTAARKTPNRLLQHSHITFKDGPAEDVSPGMTLTSADCEGMIALVTPNRDASETGSPGTLTSVDCEGIIPLDDQTHRLEITPCEGNQGPVKHAPGTIFVADSPGPILAELLCSLK